MAGHFTCIFGKFFDKRYALVVAFCARQPGEEAQQKYSTHSGLTLSDLHARKDSAAIATEIDFSAVATAAVETATKKNGEQLVGRGRDLPQKRG